MKKEQKKAVVILINPVPCINALYFLKGWIEFCCSLLVKDDFFLNLFQGGLMFLILFSFTIFLLGSIWMEWLEMYEFIWDYKVKLFI